MPKQPCGVKRGHTNRFVAFSSGSTARDVFHIEAGVNQLVSFKLGEAGHGRIIPLSKPRPEEG